MAVSAICTFVGAIVGTIMLHQEESCLRVEGSLSNLSPGQHGFHIHEYGNLGNGCLDAGAHYNPFFKDHGGPNDEIRHVGDLGNIVANEHGVAVIGSTFHEIYLHGENSVRGRALVVHSQTDDLGRGGDDESKRTGNAGSRLGCCIIT